MKRLVCLLLALLLFPCVVSLADLEDWEYYESWDFTIRYPDYLQVYGVPEEETGWNMDVFEETDGTDENGKPHILLCVIRAAEEDWALWRETACFPDTWGEMEQFQRLPVDEPDINLEVSMDMAYALYRSLDGMWTREVIFLESPTEDLDYVIVLQFPTEDDGNYQNILHWMLDTLTFPNLGTASGSFTLRSEYTAAGDTAVAEVQIDEEAPAIWLYAEALITDFAVEQVEWDDAAFTVSAVTTLYSTPRLSPGDVIAIRAYMPDMLPTLRIRGINPEGTEEIWYITESGMDGSLMLLSEADVLY